MQVSIFMLLLVGFSSFSAILGVVGNIAPRQSSVDDLVMFRMEDGKLILSDESVFTPNPNPFSLGTVTRTTTKIYSWKILDSEGYNRALERARVQEGISSLNRPVYMVTGRFLGFSPDDEPGTNYTGWLEAGGEWFEFKYNVTIQVTETIPISGAMSAGQYVNHGNWDRIIRIAVYLSWQPTTQGVIIGIMDNNVNQGYGQQVTGGSASMSFTPPYDPNHFHSIVIANPGPDSVSYSSTIWVIR